MCTINMYTYIYIIFMTKYDSISEIFLVKQIKSPFTNHRSGIQGVHKTTKSLGISTEEYYFLILSTIFE